MKTQTNKQTGIRLKGLLTKETAKDISLIDPDTPIDPEILAMAGTIKMPAEEELQDDPRLAAILGL